MLEAVFFDLDGTLCDTVPDIRKALNDALESLGYPPVSYEQTAAYVGNGARKLVERATPKGADLEEFFTAFSKYYAASENELTVRYEGMLELITKLKSQGVKLAVITNKPQIPTEKVIAKFYPDLFDFVGGDSGMFSCKPDPSLTRYAALTLRVAPKNCVFVGDGETDVLTARNAGMVGLSALWGYRSRAQLEAAGARYFAEDVPAFEKFLGKFL